MTRVLPINFGNNTSNTVTNKDTTETKDNNNKNNIKPYEYPITYEQFKNNSIAGSILGSVITGLMAAGFIKLLKFKKNTAITGGAIIGGGILLSSLYTGLNGDFKLKYLRKKQRFENPNPKAPIILSDFEPEN